MRAFVHRDGPAVLLVAIVLSALAVHGCGHGQKVLSTQASVVRAHQAERFDFYAAMDERCGDEYPDSREGYRVCMSPSRHVARASDSYRESLEAAQHVLDSSGEDAFEDMLPHLVRAARDLVEALSAAGLPIPESVAEIARLVLPE